MNTADIIAITKEALTNYISTLETAITTAAKAGNFEVVLEAKDYDANSFVKLKLATRFIVEHGFSVNATLTEITIKW